MDDQDRGIIMHAWAESVLAMTTMEMSLAVLCDNGIVPHSQLVEIVQRLRAFVESVPATAASGVSPKAEMLDRIKQTAERWNVQFSTN